jgi:plastocyanin
MAAALALMLVSATGRAQSPELKAAKATGRVHVVKMQGARFEPAKITIKRGDSVKWVLVSGGPHDVAFDTVSAKAKAQLNANMPDRITDLGGPLLLDEGETYTVSFAKIPAGRYAYVCRPHQTMGMTGTVIVK